MEAHERLTEQTCGCTDQMERSSPMLNFTYKDSNTNIWVRERTRVIDIISKVIKKMMVLDLACHHLETIRQEKTTRETSQTVEG